MLKMQQINITQEFNAPVEKVFAILSEHENLNKLFAPAKVTRLSDGQDARNGVGSARKLSIPLTPPFVETNLVYRENELIELGLDVLDELGFTHRERNSRLLRNKDLSSLIIPTSPLHMICKNNPPLK